MLIYEIQFYVSVTYGVRNPGSIFSKFVLNIDHFRNKKKSNISHVSASIYGVLREFITSRWSIPYHEYIICKRLWSHFRNSVQEIDRHHVSPKIAISSI